MARRNLDECAWCAEQMEDESRMIGRDWKVYCSPECARAGESQLAVKQALKQALERGDEPEAC